MGNDILEELRKAGLISDDKMSEELQNRNRRDKRKDRPHWRSDKNKQRASEGARSEQA